MLYLQLHGALTFSAVSVSLSMFRLCGSIIRMRNGLIQKIRALRQLYTPEELLGKLAALANLQPEAAPVRAWELVSRFLWDCVPCDNIEIYSEFG